MLAETCPVCTRPTSAPYRRIVDGKIVEGCVDECHGRFLVRPSNSASWHDRSAAKEVRKRLARGRAGKGYGK